MIISPGNCAVIAGIMTLVVIFYFLHILNSRFHPGKLLLWFVFFVIWLLSLIGSGAGGYTVHSYGYYHEPPQLVYEYTWGIKPNGHVGHGFFWTIR